MKQKNTRTILTPIGVLLMIAFFTACSSPTPTPVIDPTDTAGPTATEPATVEATSPAAEADACTNQYYPVREGATWSYASTGGPAGAYSFTDTISSVRADGFTLTSQFGDLTRTQEWSCQPEGLVALQLGGPSAAMLRAQDMQLNLEVNNVTGVTYPSQINAGDQWQHTLDFEGNMTAAGQEGTATGNAESAFNAIGIESVTVPAGTFEAMKVQVVTTLNINVTYQGLSVPVTVSGTYDYWFAEGVGWVRASGTAEMAGNSVTESIELQSYSVP